MSKISKGILGGFVGSIGYLSGYSIQGRSLVRSRKSKLSNPTTVRNQRQNKLFFYSNEFFVMYGSLLKDALQGLGVNDLNVRESVFKGANVLGLLDEGNGYANGVIIAGIPSNIFITRLGFYPNPNRLNIRFINAAYLSIQNPTAMLYFSFKSSLNNVDSSGFKSLSSNINFLVKSLSSIVKGESLVIACVIKDSSGQLLSNIYYCSVTKWY